MRRQAKFHASFEELDLSINRIRHVEAALGRFSALRFIDLSHSLIEDGRKIINLFWCPAFENRLLQTVRAAGNPFSAESVEWMRWEGILDRVLGD